MTSSEGLKEITHFQSYEVMFKRMAHQNCLMWQNPNKHSLNILQSCCYWLQHRRCDTRESIRRYEQCWRKNFRQNNEYVSIRCNIS